MSEPVVMMVVLAAPWYSRQDFRVSEQGVESSARCQIIPVLAFAGVLCTNSKFLPLVYGRLSSQLLMSRQVSS